MKEIRTDLAFESRNFYLEKSGESDISGIVVKNFETDIYSVTDVSVETNDAALKIGKPEGKYITIHSKHIMTGLYTEELTLAFSNELKKLLPSEKKNPLIFIAGLGNAAATPDSLGPSVLSSLIVTRHLPSEYSETLSLSPLCAVAPGVLGITGIETAEILSSIIKKINPDCLIAIDALASRDSSQVGCTIQLSDTGISPGSGVDNKRSAINKNTVGIPVIAVGIPTVSDISSVLYDAVSEVLSDSSFSDFEKKSLTESYIKSHSENLMVTPKNIDAIIMRASAVLSRGINMAVHKALGYHDVTEYIS